MPEIPVAGFLLEALGAVAIALMLSSLQRARPRPGVRDWSLGMWLRAAALVASIAIGRAGEPPLRTLVLALAMVLAYWSTALVVLGTWFRQNDGERAGARRSLLAVLAVLAVATTLLEPLAGSWGHLLRAGTFRLSAAAALLGASLLSLRGRAGGAGFGPRVLAAGLLGWGVEEALFFAVAASGARARPALDGSVLIEAELVLLLLTGVGMVAWLLEDERESAVRLQEALHRKEALSAMGTIVGGVAHEVRNPLFGISAALDALAAGSREGAHAPFLAAMREQVDKLSGLMAELLEYGRPIAADLKPQSLSVAVARSIGSCSALAEEAGVKVELVGEPAGDVVLMDEPRMQQVFQNLVQNAIQHSPRSGRIRLEVRPGSDPGRPGVRCSVRDSGPGFGPAELARVFEPFVSSRRGGTGLGLSIVQRIVEQHAGHVEAANHPEGGGVVTVWLPADPGAGPNQKARSAPVERSRQNG